MINVEISTYGREHTMTATVSDEEAEQISQQTMAPPLVLSFKSRYGDMYLYKWESIEWIILKERSDDT